MRAYAHAVTELLAAWIQYRVVGLVNAHGGTVHDTVYLWCYAYGKLQKQTIVQAF
jgi:hypothetical protein